MSTARPPHEGEKAPAGQAEERDDGTAQAGPAETTAGTPDRPTVIDLTDTEKPSRRFYANLADL